MVGVKKVWNKVPKGTPLRQIWSNKSFDVCAISGVLTLYDADKKARENGHLKVESSITLRRYRAPAIEAFLNASRSLGGHVKNCNFAVSRILFDTETQIE